MVQENLKTVGEALLARQVFTVATFLISQSLILSIYTFLTRFFAVIMSSNIGAWFTDKPFLKCSAK